MATRLNGIRDGDKPFTRSIHGNIGDGVSQSLLLFDFGFQSRFDADCQLLKQSSVSQGDLVIVDQAENTFARKSLKVIGFR